ncbi:uncharacterized protein LMH87_007585 [Akanthomyces muscarius]|uniref:Transmembrane protein n=1 Tax=Akanthomyces muscarius TaxID=2231603 RepID=A0A9W8QJF3_AKAMU|nr:uncharacterized protein LMH87_007585 [Akanthomyces muscarius]KAJ4161552.1 hypothetical protein LMH87_007585 [Akanthomyces muscarius]
MLSSTYTTDVLAIWGCASALLIAYIVLAVKARQTRRAATASLLLVSLIPFIVVLAIHPGSTLWYRFCRVVIMLLLAILQILAAYVFATFWQKCCAALAGCLELAWVVAGTVLLQTQWPMVLLVFGHSLFCFAVAQDFKNLRHSRETTKLIKFLYGASICLSAIAAIWAFVMFVLALRHKAIDHPVVTLYVLTILKLVPIMILDHIKDRTRESIPSESPSSPQDQSHRSVNPPILLDNISEDGAKEPIPSESCKSARGQDVSRFSYDLTGRGQLLEPIIKGIERRRQQLLERFV